jgi:hypothetical protein
MPETAKKEMPRIDSFVSSWSLLLKMKRMKRTAVTTALRIRTPIKDRLLGDPISPEEVPFPRTPWS